MDLDALLFMLEKLKEEGLPGNTPITVGIPGGFNEQLKDLVVAHGEFLEANLNTCACLPAKGLYVRLESDGTDKTGEPWVGSDTEEVLPITKMLRTAKEPKTFTPNWIKTNER